MCFMQVANDRAGVSFAITNLTTGSVVQFFQSAPQSGSGRSFKVSGATAEWVMERSADAPDPTLPAASKLRHGGFPGLRSDSDQHEHRSDDGAFPFCPERTVKISIAKPLETTEFLTVFR
jgi:hypothetical protein